VEFFKKPLTRLRVVYLKSKNKIKYDKSFKSFSLRISPSRLTPHYKKCCSSFPLIPESLKDSLRGRQQVPSTDTKLLKCAKSRAQRCGGIIRKRYLLSEYASYYVTQHNLQIRFSSVFHIIRLSKHNASDTSYFSLGAFAKFRKATISSAMPVRTSLHLSVRPHGTTRRPLDGF
jgi:hypothetical protein